MRSRRSNSGLVKKRLLYFSRLLSVSSWHTLISTTKPCAYIGVSHQQPSCLVFFFFCLVKIWLFGLLIKKFCGSDYLLPCEVHGVCVIYSTHTHTHIYIYIYNENESWLLTNCECTYTTKKIAISDGQSLSQQHKKLSQISIVDSKRPSTAVGKSFVGNTILPTRPLLTLIFDSITPS